MLYTPLLLESGMEGLPYWLANPTIVHTSSEDKKPLPVITDDLLKKLAIEDLFPFQRLLIERLMRPECGDLAVSAPTGSGKTLAYALPMMITLSERRIRKGRIRGLVVVPVKDLIGQVEETLKVVSSALGSDAHEQVIVCTPGRLQDFLARDGSDLSALEWLVIDEADRLLEHSNQSTWLPDLLTRLSQRPTPPGLPWQIRTKKLLFSATLTKNPAKLAPLALTRPELLLVRGGAEVDDATMATPDSLHEGLVVVVGREVDSWKLPALVHVLRECQVFARKVLVFARSTEAAERLASVLKSTLADWNPESKSDDVFVSAFHAHLTPPQRTAILQEFPQREKSVLVTSDALARGIHLPGVDLVINYDCPAFSSTYIHRVGRTARAGAHGVALTIVTQEGVQFARRLLEFQLGKRVRMVWREEFVKLIQGQMQVGVVGKIELGERELSYLQSSVEQALRQ